MSWFLILVTKQHALSPLVVQGSSRRRFLCARGDAFDLCNRSAGGSMQGPSQGRSGEMCSECFETPPDEVEPTSSMNSSMHRRDFLRLSGTGLAGAVLLGS